MGLALSGVECGSSGKDVELKVRGKMFACRAVNKSADRGSLWVRLSFEDRDELMDADPRTYYVTDHYREYRGVLVRLARVHPDALRDLLRLAWRFVSGDGGRQSASSRSAGVDRGS
ncbi:MAG: MmcQ/YjbR family DNA-binding protein [Candidatus Acidiferrales bacterium]